MYKCEITILENALDVEPVGGAGLVVRASPQVGSQLARSGFIHHPRIRLVDSICFAFQRDRNK